MKMSSVQSQDDHCRICFRGESYHSLVQPCNCKGSMKWVHRRCLEKWLRRMTDPKCEVCKFRYQVQRSPRSWRDWWSSTKDTEYRKELIRDSLFLLALFPLYAAGISLCIYLNSHNAQVYTRMDLKKFVLLLYTIFQFVCTLVYITWCAVFIGGNWYLARRWRLINGQLVLVLKDDYRWREQEQSTAGWVREPEIVEPNREARENDVLPVADSRISEEDNSSGINIFGRDLDDQANKSDIDMLPESTLFQDDNDIQKPEAELNQQEDFIPSCPRKSQVFCSETGADSNSVTCEIGLNTASNFEESLIAQAQKNSFHDVNLSLETDRESECTLSHSAEFVPLASTIAENESGEFLVDISNSSLQTFSLDCDLNNTKIDCKPKMCSVDDLVPKSDQTEDFSHSLFHLIEGNENDLEQKDPLFDDISPTEKLHFSLTKLHTISAQKAESLIGSEQCSENGNVYDRYIFTVISDDSLNGNSASEYERPMGIIDTTYNSRVPEEDLKEEAEILCVGPSEFSEEMGICEAGSIESINVPVGFSDNGEEFLSKNPVLSMLHVSGSRQVIVSDGDAEKEDPTNSLQQFSAVLKSASLPVFTLLERNFNNVRSKSLDCLSE